jgi:hypothetical protein
MGYYTTFYIKAIDLKPDPARPKFGLYFFEEVNLYEAGVGERRDGRFSIGDGEPCKWYEHEEDVRKLSAEYPDVVFVLDGEGEEAGDVWRKFFLNGKLVHSWSPEIKPPEWDDLDISTNLG